MGYMLRNTDKRRDPRLLMPGARSVIALVLAYKSDRLVRGIAQYAYGEDYHERMKRMMWNLIAGIKAMWADCGGGDNDGATLTARPFVDTAPICDRHWAAQAGLGWIGRNTLFLHRRYGSFCFLGEIVITASFDDYDRPLDQLTGPCVDCRLCVDACPNGAICCASSGAPMVDARRCTSYNTIENRATALPAALQRRGYVYGCDICQAVCPLNRNAPAAYTLTEERKRELEMLRDADEATFSKVTKHTAMERIKYAQWRRNIGRTREEGCS